ncbi:endolytic transglycosylase MltG [Exiguobacterium profundum]|uniref:endolytic transglycosylase MltG n=1 Tax=Exiguobacterium TaxID=33986 RepID=UPI000A07B4FF|nr:MULTISPECIES: endolytic transglycosylase MltG [Exiguobacterium]QPI66812.1 endolytic transglycosylase MltG [Exiguobacterium sp. PBE]MBG0916540.1 endolytic transglycosylase MltG [Exiguobacterium sp. SRB7LM]MCT4799466.1 endolytic transglycosylase MltG [Exiguobacterium profundum]MCV9898786.1 endolytic transglycosylase MltG [Exiguobacterium sp. N5]MDT0191090.1 endolytic transglycosylase MltG [Exiguobacterium sp. BG5(2022)]
MNHPSMSDEKRARNRIVRRITVVILAIFLLVIATGSALTYVFVKRSIEPIDPTSTETVEIEVPLGAGSGYIGELLEENGLVRSSTIFRFYTRFKNESSFQAGTYTLSPSQSIDELIETLQTGKVIVVPDIKLVIPEGFTIDQVIARLAKVAEIPKEEISEQLSDREYIQSLVNEHEMLTEEVLQEGIYHPLEGYLFPATYEFNKGVTLNEIIDEMLLPTESMYQEYKGRLADSGRTFHETLALASVVEKEAVSTEDRKEIAGVFENRLNDGMKLQSDPTVWYGTGETSIFTSFADLENDSLYNTYRYEGIPIGPIAAVSRDAFEAVLNPNDTENIYFYARPPREGFPNGEVLFEVDYEDHQQNVNKYRSEWEAFEEANSN